MNKYDTEIVLNKKSSLTYMISHIEEGSIVLEFGPATGYMTRYLCEEKKCKVYIIEIDKEAYDKAVMYAEAGVCCDAEQMAWAKAFEGIKFDYITFADVLEHIRNPEILLKTCQKFLKDEGKILASVPNITHNAVLIDLYNDKFEYRTTGIMDNTHLRFYTHDSLHELFSKSGFRIVDEDAIVFDFEYVGFGNSENDVPEDYWKEIRNRKYGFVNQFLFKLERNDSEERKIAAEVFQDRRVIQSSLYYKAGEEEYNEKQKVVIESYREDGKFWGEIDLADISDNISRVRLTPFQEYCVIEDIKVTVDSVAVDVEPIGGFDVPNRGRGFISNYPQYEILMWGRENSQTICFEGKVGNIEQSELRKYILKEQDNSLYEIERLSQILIKKEDDVYKLGMEIGRLNEIIIEKDKSIHLLGKEISCLNEVIIEKDKSIHLLGEENSRLNEVIIEKDKIIHPLGEEISHLNEVIIEKDKIIHPLGEEISHLNEVVIEKNKIIHSLGEEICRLNQVIEEKMNVIREMNDAIAEKKQGK